MWGTRKACSADTVKDTISRLISAKVSIEVKRKYKLVNGNKTVKWWHVLRGDEETMALLQKEWSKVREQTSWSIEPCFAFEDNAQVPSPESDESSIVTHNPPGDGESHTSQASVQHPTMDTSQPSDNTDASPSSTSVQNTTGCVDLTHN